MCSAVYALTAKWLDLQKSAKNNKKGTLVNKASSTLAWPPSVWTQGLLPRCYAFLISESNPRGAMFRHSTQSVWYSKVSTLLRLDRKNYPPPLPPPTQVLIWITNCEKGGKLHLYCIPMISTLLLKTGFEDHGIKNWSLSFGDSKKHSYKNGYQHFSSGKGTNLFNLKKDILHQLLPKSFFFFNI